MAYLSIFDVVDLEKHFPIPPLNRAETFVSAVFGSGEMTFCTHESLAQYVTEIRGGKSQREKKGQKDRQHKMTPLKEMKAGCAVETLSFLLLK